MGTISVLVIGLEPSLIDFSEAEYSKHAELSAETDRAGLDREKASLDALEFDTRLCMIDLGEAATRAGAVHLGKAVFDCVVNLGSLSRDFSLSALMIDRPWIRSSQSAKPRRNFM